MKCLSWLAGGELKWGATWSGYRVFVLRMAYLANRREPLIH